MVTGHYLKNDSTSGTGVVEITNGLISCLYIYTSVLSSSLEQHYFFNLQLWVNLATRVFECVVPLNHLIAWYRSQRLDYPTSTNTD